jgi:ribosomal protein S16
VVVKTGGLSAAEMRIVGMFSKDPWGSGDTSKTNMLAKHPIEALYGVPRPTSLLSDDTRDGFGSLRLERRDYWDKWGTQLSDAVTLLNQKNQLKQNEIESATKESNRHFDLGNNALRKMNEMLMSIGRM